MAGDRAADDFAAIAARMREIANDNPRIGPDDEPEFCPRCENGGWLCSAHPASGQPVFRECERCGNPENHPCP